MSMTEYAPGEGPITEDEAKRQAEADDAAVANDDSEPPAEPLEDANPGEQPGSQEGED